MDARKTLKVLHTIGSTGLAGGLAAFLILLSLGPEPAVSTEYLNLREGLYAISHSLVLPSMAVVFLSGVLSMAVHFPFQNALWVWLKLAAGFLIFESLLATVDGPSRRAVEAARKAMDGELGEEALQAAVMDRPAALWVLLTLAGLNVLLAIWRPRFRSKRAATS